VKAGELVFHKVGDEIRVLEDVNSFVSVTVDKNEDFTSNQVIRVLDQIGNDIAVLFNTKYLGKVQNNNAGRLAFWNDIVTYNKELERLEAIEGFISDDLTVEQGNDKKSVVVVCPVSPVCAMTKLYMTVIVQ
ncbi:phage tail protein, partial [Anaerotignum faecicola]|nr:phage tail protein [Anaerotignum faecicola]